MTGDELKRLVAAAEQAYAAMTPEQRAEHDRRQRESWVRGEMALGREERKTTRIAPTPPPPDPRDARIAALEAGLVKAVIPLEALRFSGGDKRHCAEVQRGIAEAVETVRALLAEGGR